MRADRARAMKIKRSEGAANARKRRFSHARRDHTGGGGRGNTGRTGRGGDTKTGRGAAGAGHGEGRSRRSRGFIRLAVAAAAPAPKGAIYCAAALSRRELKGAPSPRRRLDARGDNGHVRLCCPSPSPHRRRKEEIRRESDDAAWTKRRPQRPLAIQTRGSPPGSVLGPCGDQSRGSDTWPGQKAVGGRPWDAYCVRRGGLAGRINKLITGRGLTSVPRRGGARHAFGRGPLPERQMEGGSPGPRRWARRALGGSAGTARVGHPPAVWPLRASLSGQRLGPVGEAGKVKRTGFRERGSVYRCMAPLRHARSYLVEPGK